MRERSCNLHVFLAADGIFWRSGGALRRRGEVGLVWPTPTYDPWGWLRSPYEKGAPSLGYDGGNALRFGTDAANAAWTA